MAAEYAFRTRWVLDAPPERCGRVLVASLTGDGTAWWPGVRVVGPARRVAPGEALALVVRSPLGYRLRCTLRITRVEAGPVLAAESTGDLHGTGRVEVGVHERGTQVRFTWEVVVRRWWMRAASPVLRPVFALAHALVMCAGERGLRRALR